MIQSRKELLKELEMRRNLTGRRPYYEVQRDIHTLSDELDLLESELKALYDYEKRVAVENIKAERTQGECEELSSTE